jgi:hypothetical protein
MTVTHSEQRFRELLEKGRIAVSGVRYSLEELTKTEWAALYKFAASFFREFESFAPEDLFPAFREVVERKEEKFLR